MLKNLKISNWRQYSELNIEFHPKLTVITGANGSGKTTVLNLLSQTIGWSPRFVSSFNKDESGVYKYSSGVNGDCKKSEITIAEEVDGFKFPHLTVGELKLKNYDVALNMPSNVDHGLYSLRGKKNILKGVYINSHRPNFQYRKLARAWYRATAGLFFNTLSLTTRVVTGASEYFENNASWPIHKPIITFKSARYTPHSLFFLHQFCAQRLRFPEPLYDLCQLLRRQEQVLIQARRSDTSPQKVLNRCHRRDNPLASLRLVDYN